MSNFNIKKVDKNKKYKQGFYNLKNPDKYINNPTKNPGKKIACRSSWEFYACKFFDNNPNVLEWSSEEFYIPYIRPTDGKVHRYYPDFWVKFKNVHGDILQEIIEVKPKNQVQPELKKRLTEYDKLEYNVNRAKWIAAAEFCKKRKIKFRILTEQSIFNM